VVKDQHGKNTMLKMPKLSDYGVNTSSGENDVALLYVNMLEPYMQKWIIPYSVYIDTQDEKFVDAIMSYIYHPATISLFSLKQATKTSEFQYYLECNEYRYSRYVRKEDKESDKGERADKQDYEFVVSNNDLTLYKTGLNTKDKKLGEYIVSDTFYEETDSGEYVYKQVISKIELTHTPTIAVDSSGNKMVKKVAVERKIEDNNTSPVITHYEDFYKIVNNQYEIIPIDETKDPSSSTPGDLVVDESTGIGKQTVVDVWNETLSMVNSETKKYEVSYYTEEQMEKLGRDISRIEWYQDRMGVLYSAIHDGAPGEGQTVFEGAYNGTDGRREVIERMWDGFVSWGFTEEQAAAMIAHSALESSFWTDAVNSSSEASGLGQWLGPRRTQLMTFAASQGKSWTDLELQIQYFCMEVDDNMRYPYATYQWLSAYYAEREIFRTGEPAAAAVAFRQGIGRGGAHETQPERVSREAIAVYETLKGRTIQYPIDKVMFTGVSMDIDISATSGISSADTQYSYDDMYFAYYQIENWYGHGSSGVVGDVYIPEGEGFMTRAQRDALMADFFDGNVGIQYNTTEAEVLAYQTWVDVPIIDQNGQEDVKSIQIHRKLAGSILQIFTEIKAGGFPIRKSDTGAYNWRGGQKIGESRELYSMHCLGLAIDVNWNSNYYVDMVTGAALSAGHWKPGIDPLSMPVDGVAVTTFKKYGWRWGGDWTSTKDYMHFSVTGN